MTGPILPILSMNEYKLAIQSFNAESSYAEIERLQNSNKHLRRSNAELLDVIHEDESYGTYVDENESVIELNNQRIAALEEHIQKLKTTRGGSHVGSELNEKEIHDFENRIEELERANDEILDNAYEDESVGEAVEANKKEIVEYRSKILALKEENHPHTEPAGIHI
ncbi:hypothetical protein AWJ20_1274 [Sugiyamaella lignohabitans]|uniref:Uncharacterized protein n=1 Tax=Sugiyamaella lignohabitans TaxID=796027 RepID=A0A167DJV6_9ASCO|nr:uncharacterized protein AWJ20_1274 [Sugiyamaella lignohabitans]ANB12996.1 hypothetical protein AWJ20_1274 [Sugiyamaella lignohabitans]